MEHAHLPRKLTAVLFADVVGYSRLMNLDEETTHALIIDCETNLIKPTIAEYRGRLIRTMGDGFLASFESASDAVLCGLSIQDKVAHRNAGVPANRQILLRMGANTGDAIFDDQDIYGNSVNIAARLESLAEPGQLYVTRGVRDQLEGYPALSFEDKGEKRVKNIDHPVRVYRVRNAEQQEPRHLFVPLSELSRQVRYVIVAARRPSWMMLLGLLALIATLELHQVPLVREIFGPTAEASIMVLPFRNMSGDPQQEYFADALTDELTTDLSRLSGALVISSASAFTYKDKNVDPRDVGREFGVHYLLAGNIRKVGTKIETHAQFIDAHSAAQIWAERFDNDISGLYQLQKAVTGRIAASLHTRIGRAFAERPVDPEAIDLRFRAMALLIHWFAPESTLAARHSFKASLDHDRGSAETWAQLSNVLIADYLNRWNDAEKDQEARSGVLQQAEEALNEALKLDPSLALSHYAAGFIHRIRGEHQRALEAFDLAVKLDPNFAGAYAQKANEMVFLGRADKAPALVTEAVRRSPRDQSLGVFYWIIGRAYFMMKKYEEAIVWLRKSVELRPNLWFNRAHLIGAYALTGHTQEAAEALKAFYDRFSGYDVKHITEIYDHESYSNKQVQAGLQELFKGLRLAGLP